MRIRRSIVLLLPAVAALGPVACAGQNHPEGPVPGRAPATFVEADTSQAGPQLSPIRAGAAFRVITPEFPPGGPAPRMAGFGPGRGATGVHDDLSARALVLEAGGTSVAIAALDLIGFFHDDVVRTREEIHRRHPEVTLDYVLVCSTHTHAGPDVIGLWTRENRAVDGDYIARVRSAAADAVAEAWHRRRPARLSFAETDLPDLVTDSRLPVVVDPTARLLKVDSVNGGQTIALLLNYSNHPESLGRHNTLISSDYPGVARRALEDAFGGVALFTSGDIGGLLTPLRVARSGSAGEGPAAGRTVAAMEELGQEVARRVIAAWRSRADVPEVGPAFVERAALEIRSRRFRVPLHNPRFVEGLRTGRIWPREVSADGTLGTEAAIITLRRPSPAAGQGADPAVPLARLVCVPGEIYPELVLGGIQDPQDPGADHPGAPKEPALRSLAPARHFFLIGLCNDELGYIIPGSQWDEQPPYAYGREKPQYGEINSVGPQVAPILMEVFQDLLR